jgi:lysophospholipase L1-like esterase
MTREQTLAVTQDRASLRRNLDANGAGNLPLLGAALEAAALSCARQGATLVLLENPHLASDLDSTFASWWGPYQATVRQIAARHGLRYVNLADQLTLAPDDFIDAVHMSPKGRDAWSAQLLRVAPSWRVAEH